MKIIMLLLNQEENASYPIDCVCAYKCRLWNYKNKDVYKKLRSEVGG